MVWQEELQQVKAQLASRRDEVENLQKQLQAALTQVEKSKQPDMKAEAPSELDSKVSQIFLKLPQPLLPHLGCVPLLFSTLSSVCNSKVIHKHIRSS